MSNCCVKISSGGYLERFHPCPNQGKYQTAGKWYCGMHDPKRIAARRAKIREKLDKEREQRTEYYKRKEMLSVFAEGIQTKDLDNYELVLKSGH